MIIQGFVPLMGMQVSLQLLVHFGFRLQQHQWSMTKKLG